MVPQHNGFAHQDYYQADDPDCVETLKSGSPIQPSEDQFLSECRRDAAFLSEQGIDQIDLVHGTFVGNDLFGIIREIGRWRIGLRARLQELQKELTDRIIGNIGNFTDEFAEQLSQASGVTADIFSWSGENHHFGRVEAALHLLHRWINLDPVKRILCWAHSHGGNVLALITNLLQATSVEQRKFFYCIRDVHDSEAITQEVREWLSRGDRQGLANRLDLVTLGTPIRYGWDMNGCRSLLHIVHHRSQDESQTCRATFPFSLDDAIHGVGGDYVQQIGIAGTNIAPPLTALRLWRADQRLNHLLQRDIRRRDLWKRLKLGKRIHSAGSTKLIDYEQLDSFAEHVFGHAVYTRLQWLPFHLKLINEHLTSQNRD